MNSIEEHLPPAYQHCSLQPCSVYFLLSLTLIFKVKLNIQSSLSSSWCYSHFVTTYTRISNWTRRSCLSWKGSFGTQMTTGSGPEQQDYQEKKNQCLLLHSFVFQNLIKTMVMSPIVWLISRRCLINTTFCFPLNGNLDCHDGNRLPAKPVKYGRKHVLCPSLCSGQ